MKATATSKFHGNLEISFSRLQPGKNYRKLRGAYSKYCLGDGNKVCGCGWPVTRTKWTLSSKEFEVGYVAEVGGPGNRDYGHGYIEIDIYPAHSA